MNLDTLNRRIERAAEDRDTACENLKAAQAAEDPNFSHILTLIHRETAAYHYWRGLSDARDDVLEARNAEYTP